MERRTKGMNMDLQKSYAELWNRSSEFFYSKGYYSWMREALEGCNTILEIGCGCGYSTLSLLEAGHRVLAVDKNSECVDKAYNLTKEKGFENEVAYLELDVSEPGVVEELVQKYQFDAVVCWNMGFCYDQNEFNDIHVPRMLKYGLSIEDIQSNITSSYCEYIIWTACKIASMKGVPIQIVDRGERKITASNDVYYNHLGMEFGYKGIGYHNKDGESLSGEGVSLLKQGVIQTDAIVPIVFNMIILA